MLGRWSLPHASRLGRTRSPSQPQWRSEHNHVSVARGDALGPTRDDTHQTFRVRKDGDGKELPLPPVLDPIVLQSRAQWDKHKPQPNPADFTPFQKKLQANPFAHALASPLRQCRATQISLPTAFMTSLHTRPHPTTEDPWLLPISLTTKENNLGHPYRIIGRRLVIDYLGKKKQWQKGINSRMEAHYGSTKVARMVWREDLPSLVTDLMQKQLTNKLSWNFTWRGRLIPVASPRNEDIEKVDDVSCVLIFGSLRTRADEIQEQSKSLVEEMQKWSSYIAKGWQDKLDPHRSPEVTHTSPAWYVEPLVPHLQPRIRCPELEFKTTTWRSRKVPLYSLTDLLGEEKARQLIEGSKYAGERCVVLKSARHNVPVEILLMRLQAYITECGP